MINRMQNNSLGLTNIFRNSKTNVNLLNEKKDNFAKRILKQIDNLKKQIEEINKRKGGDKEKKINQVKNIQKQIEELNKQLVEKQKQEQTEQRTKHISKNKKSNNLTGYNNSNEYTDVFLEANNTLYKMKSISKVKSSIRSSSNILKSEAKLDKQRDKFGNAYKIIESKLSKANELEARANSLDKEISSEFVKENRNNEKAINNKVDKDEQSIKEDNEKKKNIERIKIYTKNISKDNSDLDIIA